MNADPRNDLLLGPADNLVSVQYVLTALRRRRRLLAGLAAAGLCLGLLLSVAVPKTRTASTSMLLAFPTASDPTRAMATDVSLLQTRAVSEATLKSLGLNESVESFQSSIHSTILSDAVLRITVKGPSASQAVARSTALSRAFLAFRKTVYDYQLSVVNGVLEKQEKTLKTQVDTANYQISNFDPATALPNAPSLADLLSQRAAETDNIAQLESQIQTNTLATATVVSGSRVIDPASPLPIASRRVLVTNAASGVVAALALGAGVITLLAVVSTRLRRRADVAAALRAPVLLSVGPVLPPSSLRALTSRVRVPAALTKVMPTLRGPDDPSDDLKLVVRHLQTLMTSASPQPPALVVVSIGNIDLAAATVHLLVERLSREGQQVVVLNETGRPLPGAANAQPAPAADDAGVTSETDAVVVVAVLDPAKGAEHLREWATDAVVLVTAGRSTATTLESQATMVRAAGLHLRSVVLVGCDPDDDTLGTFDAGPTPPAKTRAARAPRKATKARST